MDPRERPIVRKVWGQETWIENNDRYCLKEMILWRRAACSVHWHPLKDETFYVTVGKMVVAVGDKFKLMLPGDSIRIRPGMRHSFYGVETTSFFEVSTTHSDEDVKRATESVAIIEQREWEKLVMKSLWTCSLP